MGQKKKKITHGVWLFIVIKDTAITKLRQIIVLIKTSERRNVFSTIPSLQKKINSVRYC